MSDGRKILSGAAYKKRALDKTKKGVDILSKTAKLHHFFIKGGCDNASSTSTLTNKTGTINADDAISSGIGSNLCDDCDGIDNSSGNQCIFEPCDESLLLSTDDNVDISIPTSCPQPNLNVGENLEHAIPIEGTKDIMSKDNILSDDPAKWIISDYTRDFVAIHGCNQNRNLDFSGTQRLYSDGKPRWLTDALFDRMLRNGEKVPRPWLIYSDSKKSVFCVACLLFDANCSFNGKAGFNDWRHGVRLTEHENSKNHKKCMLTLKERSQLKRSIDNDLIVQLEKEMSYWRNVLKRVVAATKALASRGLPFRGSEEKLGSPNNGNFLMLMEFLSLFDPFLEEHIRKFSNKGSGSTSYISKTIYEEFIQILADKVTSIIAGEIKFAKYFAIIVDSTPDISHVDQLSFVLRYMQKDGTPVERFLMFIENTGHKAEDLFIAVISALECLGLDISDCRSQSYDNANNVSGIYSGLQARVKEINNLAEHAPCAAHSLNLVGLHAVESAPEAASFFNTVQSLYNFFTASTHRWDVLQTHAEKKIVLKSLSATRWSARQEAVQVLHQYYGEIIETLILIEENMAENGITRPEAKGLRIQLERLETTFMQILWNFLLTRFNAVSRRFQRVDISIADVIDDYRGLIKVVANTRTEFEVYENKALEISESQEYQTTTTRRRRRKLKAGESRDGEVQLSGRDSFRVNTFNVIIDHLDGELRKRCGAYERIFENFSVITEFGSLSSNEIRERAERLRKVYNTDLECLLDDEFVHFHAYCSEKKLERDSPSDLLNLLRTNELYAEFPNVEIAYRIFITLASTNCSAERSFSCLKRVKNYLRATMGTNRLNSLAILCIESDLLQTLDCEELITQFAEKKVRRVCI